MTQQYLAGELSVILGEVQAAATTEVCARRARDLRLEVESAPVAVLPSAAARALALINGLCWESLVMGDTAAFARQAAICAELHEFGVCAHLLNEELNTKAPPGRRCFPGGGPGKWQRIRKCRLLTPRKRRSPRHK
jgi:hypothetical protein